MLSTKELEWSKINILWNTTEKGYKRKSGISANIHIEELKGNIYLQIPGDDCVNCVRKHARGRGTEESALAGQKATEKEPWPHKRTNSQASVLGLWLDPPRYLWHWTGLITVGCLDWCLTFAQQLWGLEKRRALSDLPVRGQE